MTHLPPEVRVNKNSNAFTRWVRSLSKKHARAAIELEASNFISRSDREAMEACEQATIELCGILHPANEYNQSSNIAFRIKVIYQNDPVLLQHIIEAARRNEFEREHWLDRLHLTTRLNRWDHEKLEEELSTFRTAINVTIMVRHLANNGVTISEQSPNLLQATVSIILEDGGIENPSSDLVQALTFIAYIKGLPNAVPWKKGPNNVSDIYNSIEADVAYIAEHLEEVVVLLPELIRRCTHDHRIIGKFLNSETQALREGEL